MSKAKQLKDQGNSYFKKGNYFKAISLYSQAIELEKDPVFFSNRSSCYFQLSNYIKAREDAEAAIMIDANFEKGYYKAGQACKKLGEFEKAVDYFGKGLTIGNDPSMRKELEEAQLLLKYTQ